MKASAIREALPTGITLSTSTAAVTATAQAETGLG